MLLPTENSSPTPEEKLSPCCYSPLTPLLSSFNPFLGMPQVLQKLVLWRPSMSCPSHGHFVHLKSTSQSLRGATVSTWLCSLHPVSSPPSHRGTYSSQSGFLPVLNLPHASRQFPAGHKITAKAHLTAQAIQGKMNTSRARAVLCPAGGSQNL